MDTSYTAPAPDSTASSTGDSETSTITTDSEGSGEESDDTAAASDDFGSPGDAGGAADTSSKQSEPVEDSGYSVSAGDGGTRGGNDDAALSQDEAKIED